MSHDYVGNYLEWRYGADANAYVDDRPDAATLVQYARLLRLEDGWADDLRSVDPDVVLWHADKGLSKELEGTTAGSRRRSWGVPHLLSDGDCRALQLDPPRAAIPAADVARAALHVVQSGQLRPARARVARSGADQSCRQGVDVRALQRRRRRSVCSAESRPPVAGGLIGERRYGGLYARREGTGVLSVGGS